jgi:hypothetical protein
MLPVSIVFIPASIIVGRLVTRLNRFRVFVWSGWAVTTIGLSLHVIPGVHTGEAIWAVLLIIVGTGHGSLLISQNVGSQAVCLPGDEIAAAGMYMFVRSLGMALGVGLGSTVFQNIMLIKLRQLGLPESIAKNSEAFISELTQMPASKYKTDVLSAFVYGFRGTFGCFAALAGFTGLISLLLRNYGLDKKGERDHSLEDREKGHKKERDLQQPMISMVAHESQEALPLGTQGQVVGADTGRMDELVRTLSRPRSGST